MPLFSVIIPVHNRPELVAATLQTVFNQSFKDYEVLVIDDGSDEETARMLAGYGDRIHVLRQDQQGPGAARDRGIAEASGQYLAFLDSDDLWYPWTLMTYYLAIQSRDQPAFVTSTEQPFRTMADLAGRREPSFEVTDYEDYYAASHDPRWIPICGTAVRADRLRAVGGFGSRQANYEETDLWMRLGTAPGFVRIESPRCSARRVHDQMISADMDRNCAGVTHLIEQEKQGAYPGGTERHRQRIELITRHVRPVSFALLRAGRTNDAWDLYRRSFGWNVALSRVRYLLGFAALATWRDWFGAR